jgi:CubicO group peptidase (beta-lactamase class C family)
MNDAVRRTVALCAGFVLLVGNVPAQSQTAEDSAAGIWASETIFGPALRGELTVTRTGPAWRAVISRAESRFAVTGDRVRFAFPGDRGKFRGALSPDQRTIAGFWMQPSGATADRRDPGGSGQRFASRLVLRRTAADLWRGTVRPLDDRFTLYLKIYRNANGVLAAAFRNPELNSIGGSTLFRVTHEGDSVQFTARTDDTRPEIRISATFARSPDRLTLVWPDAGRTLELTRRTPAQASDFFPRPAGGAPYAYRVPAATGDGWETASARDAGMDDVALARVVQRLIDVDPSAARPALVHSILVAHRGKLVLEEYFFGFDRDRMHDIRSAGKTFGSIMLGAPMNGSQLTADTPVYRLLAGMGPFANPDPRKSQITLAHLMTHTTGLACDDNDSSSPGEEGRMQSQTAQPNWWKYTLDLPMAHDPGTRYAYCSANANLVGAALTTATGTWLPELFERTVAAPMQFGPHYWNLMPTGEGYLGGGAFLRPRDLLKVGQTYLDGGVWHGRRLIDAAWVKNSTAPHAEISPATTGLDANRFSESYIAGHDGYGWHLNTMRAGDRTYREYEANGNGGQLLMVFPELDLAVVFTAGNYMQGGIWGHFRDQIVAAEIIPAIQR